MSMCRVCVIPEHSAEKDVGNGQMVEQIMDSVTDAVPYRGGLLALALALAADPAKEVRLALLDPGVCDLPPPPECGALRACVGPSELMRW